MLGAGERRARHARSKSRSDVTPGSAGATGLGYRPVALSDHGRGADGWQLPGTGVGGPSQIPLIVRDAAFAAHPGTRRTVKAMSPSARAVEDILDLRREAAVRLRAHQPAKLWNAVLSCAACGRRLIPLSYPLSPSHDARGEERPPLKCHGCGQPHRWDDSCGWVLADTRVFAFTRPGAPRGEAAR
jgi:hypothetical protein